MVDQVIAAQQYVAAVTAERPPASPEYLAGRLASFMAHFYIQVTDEKLRGLKVAIASDWLECLKYFPRDVIEKAFADWRDSNTNKPKPAEIRQLCIRFFGSIEWDELERVKVVAKMTPSFTPDEPKQEEWKPPTEEEKARVAELLKGCGIGQVSA